MRVWWGWLAALFLAPSEYELEVMRADLALARARLDAANRLILDQAEMILDRDTTILTLRAQRRKERTMSEPTARGLIGDVFDLADHAASAAANVAGQALGAAGDVGNAAIGEVEGVGALTLKQASDLVSRLLQRMRDAAGA